jgi:hypothetical protein
MSRPIARLPLKFPSDPAQRAGRAQPRDEAAAAPSPAGRPRLSAETA